MTDPWDLERFVEAQAGCYDTVLAELRAARKRTHWIWFIFPQLTDLGHSVTARRYGLAGRAEARGYLEHPVLGPRLRQCCRLVAAIHGRSVQDVFGFPDYLKVRSCMTLFAHSTDDNGDFVAVLAKHFVDLPDGRQDPATLTLLGLS